jgi:hypothetical protein
VAGTLGALGTLGNVGNLFKACFVAGTPLLTPEGSKAIEEFVPGDLVLSKDEFNADGEVRAKRVLQKFVRVSPILNLHVEGRIIGTTAEYPFYVNGKGWIAAHYLQIGDELQTDDSRWVKVEGIAPSGRVETVYNVEVADCHTYFVGGGEWGFSVWAHNAAYGFEGASDVNSNLVNRMGNSTNGLLNDTIPVMSGRLGGPAAEVFGSTLPSLSENAGIAAFHAEGQAVATMIQNGYTEASLFINYASGPCGICREGIPQLMQEGTTLWVVSERVVGYFTTGGWTRLL